MRAQPSIRSGECLKKGHGLLGGWAERWVELTGEKLRYYKRKGGKLKGELDLTQCTIVDDGTEGSVNPPGLDKGFVFTLLDNSGKKKNAKGKRERAYHFYSGEKDFWQSSIRHNILLLNKGYAWQREEEEGKEEGGDEEETAEENSISLDEKLAAAVAKRGSCEVLAALGIEDEDDVLVIGSGNGFRLEECVLRSGAAGKCTGFEWSQRLRDETSERLGEAVAERRVQVIGPPSRGYGDASGESFKELEEGGYDKILLSHARYLKLFFFAERDDLLLSLYRLLAPGGRIAVVVEASFRGEEVTVNADVTSWKASLEACGFLKIQELQLVHSSIVTGERGEE